MYTKVLAKQQNHVNALMLCEERKILTLTKLTTIK